MLTASLQSTWEQKNRQQTRQKYGTYQNGFSSGEEVVDMSRSITYGSQERNFGKTNNYSVQQAQQNAFYSNSNGQTESQLPNLKIPQMGATRLNVGQGINGMPAGGTQHGHQQGVGSAGPSPRGAQPQQYGAAGSSSGYSTMGGGTLSGGNSLYLTQQQQGGMYAQHSGAAGPVNAGNSAVPVNPLGMPAKKHRASSRQSNHKGNRRGQHRYVESPNYNPPHGSVAGADQAIGVGGGGGSGSGKLGPGHSMAGPSFGQPTAPSPNSTLLMSAEGAGHHHQAAPGHGHFGQPHASHVLPHISGAGGAGPAALLGATMHQPPQSASKHGSGNLRSQYLSQMNNSSPPHQTATAGGPPNAASIPAYALTSAPVVREFQNGNMLIATEEHGHSGVTSIRGMKPGNPNWINQDNFFITENFDGRDVRVYCVLDGHGEHGHLVSRRCREAFPQFLKSARLDVDAAFNMMQNDLTSASDMDVRCSGATCVMATIIGGRLAVYNCGDSRAVLGRRNPNGSIYAVALSKDHKPDKPEERKRILSCGGHLGCRQVLVNQPGRGPVSMPVGPCRVWYQHRGETLGLAMSRSLGDSIVHKSGVSAEPECIDRMVDDYDEFFILATDGVWDVVDNNYAVQLVQSFAAKSANWNPLEASSSICRFARSRWEKLSPMIDDITCIVVKVHR